MKRSPDERDTKHTEAQLKRFERSQMSFSIRRVNVCEYTIKMAPCESFGKVPSEGMRQEEGEKWREN